ncbi:hypothetical protein CYMTET_17157 [Cymbomonas tetramitiformis]|uniref:Uncharacterized protein n=1 Tax=Cymbomonas tetramitiformis TaxID=36881 RepID=A0AAE0GB61_9CHLO|nr:hypothetical protein CYMTET_17157 [Cymbomonas tetramitiformis]
MEKTLDITSKSLASHQDEQKGPNSPRAVVQARFSFRIVDDLVQGQILLRVSDHLEIISVTQKFQGIK